MVLLALAAGFAVATVPDGPRLAFLTASSSKPVGIGIDSAGPLGMDLQQVLTRTSSLVPLPIPSGLAWSPDGSLLAFTGIDNKRKRLGIAVVGADGSAPRILPGAENGLFPVFAPDGGTIAFVRVRSKGISSADSVGHPSKYTQSSAIFTVSVDGKGLRRLTPWRSGGGDQPSSYSPDGSLLAITHSDRKGHSNAVALQTDGSGATVLIRDAGEPIYSPDGSHIAVLRATHRPVALKGTVIEGADLYVANADGSGLVRLTDRPNKPKLWPSWDPSGERLAFTEFRARSFANFLFGIGNAIMEINADGTCPITVLAARHTGFSSAAWQPGFGREAGRIAC